MGENETAGVGDDLTADMVPGGGAPAETDQAEKPKQRRQRKPKGYIRVQLEESDDIPPSGLFIGVDDSHYLLQPGMEVDVPQGVVDVLENAVISVPKIDPSTRRVIGYKDRLKYPFRKL